MHNLRVSSASFSLPRPSGGAEVTAWCVDAETSTAYGLTSTHLLASDGSCAAPLCGDVPGESWAGARYLAETGSICAYTASGHIVSVAPAAGATRGTVAAAGTVDEGLLSMDWSPDEECAACVLRTGGLLLMSSEFEVIAEAAPSDGSGGGGGQPRACASWRQDGTSFAAGSCGEDVRIFDRHGGLQATARRPGWRPLRASTRPVGNLVAVLARDDSGEVRVLLFERNGEYSSEFGIGCAGSEQLDIGWSSDGDLLSVLSRSSEAGNAVQIWHRKNYHWYLKRTVRYSACSQCIAVHWDEERPSRVYCAMADGSFDRHDLAWERTVSTNGDGTVAVIDGPRLLLTPLALVVVPPPMCATALTLPADETAELVAFAHQRRGLAVVGSQGGIFVFDAPSTTGSPAHREIALLRGSVPQCLAWPRPDTLLAAVPSESGGSDLVELSLSRAAVSSRVRSERVVLSMVVAAGECGGQTVLQFSDGSFGAHEERVLSPWALGPSVSWALPAVCVVAIAHPGAGSTAGGHIEVAFRVISLDAEGRLLELRARRGCVEEQTALSLEATSFALVGTSHVLWTTWANRLLTRSLGDQLAVDAGGAPDAGRQIERGACIVFGSSDKAKVVLQLPRGNLETVFPRVLVRRAIASSLRADQLGVALDLARRHRIDVNLLFDQDSEQFLMQLPLLVRQVDDVERLNVFIAAIRVPEEAAVANSILGGLQEALLAADGTRFMSCILACYLKTSPPQLVPALGYVRQQLSRGRLSADELSEALSTLIYLSNADQLFNAALGEDDLDMALCIANLSNRDPRETQRDLDKLRSITDVHLRRYTINVLLERWESAMFHLREAGDDAFDSAVELIQAHGLHAAALKLWPDGTAQHTKIQLLYGGQLRDSKQFVESALVFSQCGSAADALEAWTCAVADEPSTWRWAIVTAEGMDLPLTSMQAACARVGALLVQQHAYTDAALVFCDYAGDVDEGVDALLQGKHWSEAARCCAKFRRSDLIKTLVLPAVVEGGVDLVEDLSTRRDALAAAHERLLAIWQLRLKQSPVDLLSGAGEHSGAAGTQDHSDDRSTASFGQWSFASGTSARSSISSGSTTGTRKQRRRARTIPAGSAQDEEYQMKQVSKLMPDPELRREVNDAVLALRYHRCDSSGVHGALQDFEATARDLKNAAQPVQEQVAQRMREVALGATAKGLECAEIWERLAAARRVKGGHAQ